jgi:hypothetical protein
MLNLRAANPDNPLIKSFYNDVPEAPDLARDKFRGRCLSPRITLELISGKINSPRLPKNLVMDSQAI